MVDKATSPENALMLDLVIVIVEVAIEVEDSLDSDLIEKEDLTEKEVEATTEIKEKVEEKVAEAEVPMISMLTRTEREDQESTPREAALPAAIPTSLTLSQERRERDLNHLLLNPQDPTPTPAVLVLAATTSNKPTVVVIEI